MDTIEIVFIGAIIFTCIAFLVTLIYLFQPKNMKNSRFMPCAAICGVAVKSERYIRKSPPPPTPSPESTDIKKETINDLIKATAYLIIKSAPERITSAANRRLSVSDRILSARIPPTMPPNTAGRTKSPKPREVRSPRMA